MLRDASAGASGVRAWSREAAWRAVMHQRGGHQRRLASMHSQSAYSLGRRHEATLRDTTPHSASTSMPRRLQSRAFSSTIIRSCTCEGRAMHRSGVVQGGREAPRDRGSKGILSTRP